jgi:ubiquinone biosynthesis protein UbiJ
MLLAVPALGFVNHLLAAEPWARERLAGFAGKIACVHFGSGAVLHLRISEAGLLEEAEAGSAAAVSIGLPDDVVIRALTDPPSLFSSATISGAADLAETLGFVFRNLRWDIEHDLSRVTGDILAHRALQLARGLLQWQWRAARNLALGMAEYLTEEEQSIARRGDVEQFCSAVDALRDDCARVEKRLLRIESA